MNTFTGPPVSTMMKTKLLLGLPAILLVTSCVVPPPPPPPHPHSRARSPHSPGGRAVLPGELHPRSPWSPGGRVVLPREARRTVYRGGVYYVHRDVWYRPYQGGYVIVTRPY